MCFPQIHTACLRDHIPATLKRLGLVLRPDSGCALLINNTERGGVEFCTEACRRVTRAILKLSISHESWDVCPHAWERSVLYRDPTAWILDQNDVFFPPYYKVLNGREVGHDGDWRQRRLWQTQIQMSVGFSPEISVVFFFFFFICASELTHQGCLVIAPLTAGGAARCHSHVISAESWKAKKWINKMKRHMKGSSLSNFMLLLHITRRPRCNSFLIFDCSDPKLSAFLNLSLSSDVNCALSLNKWE